MTPEGKDPRHGVDEGVAVVHAPILKSDHLLFVGPLLMVVTLDPLCPLEHSGGPLELLGDFACARGLGIGAEVHIRIQARAALPRRAGTQVVVELANVAVATSKQGAASPVAAAFDISPSRRIGVGGSLDHGATVGVPIARDVVQAGARPARQRRGSPNLVRG